MTDRKEWLKARHGAIGGSDAASLYGKSPYKTKYELYLEKTSPLKEEATNPIFEKGHEYERKSRTLFAENWNKEYSAKEAFEAKDFALSDFPFCRASLDGISLDGSVITEFKYVGKEVFESGLVPEHYKIQIMHQLMCSHAKKAFYVCTTDGREIKTLEVERDEAFIKEHKQKCIEFWTKHVIPRKAPELSDKDYKEIKGHDQLINHYTSLKLQLETLEKLVEMAKEKIITIVDHPRMKCGDFKIQKITAKGNINYKDLISEKHIASAIKRNKINLESFRGSEKTFYKITTGNREKD